MQVLVLGAIIASIVILMMRFTVTRTVNVLKTKNIIAAKIYAESCIAQYTAVAVALELKGLPPPQSFTCNINGVEKPITTIPALTPTMQISLDVTAPDALE